MSDQKFTNIFELAEHVGVQFSEVQLLIKRNKISVHESHGYLILNSDSIPDYDQTEESIFDEQLEAQLLQQYLDELEGIVLKDENVIRALPSKGDITQTIF
jgi:hypothetical protein